MEQDRYPKASRGWIGVGMLFALYTLSLMDRQVLNLLVDPVSQALDIGDLEMSFLLGGSFAIFYGIVGLPLARLADTSNRRNLIVAGALLWGCCTVLSGFADSFAVLVLLRIGLAVGEAALSPAAYSMIADWFPPNKRAFPTTVYTWGNGFGAKFGMAVLGFVVLLIVERQVLSHIPVFAGFQPWQLMFFVVGIPALLLGGLFAIVVREPVRQFAKVEHAEAPSWAQVRGHIRENPRLYRGLLLGCGLNNMAVIALALWAPQIMKRNYGWDISDAAMALGILSAATSVFGFLILPRLSDIIRDRTRRPDAPIWMSIIMSILGCGCLALAPIAHDATTFLVLDGIGVPLAIASSMLTVTSLPIIAPPRMRAVLASMYLLVASALTTTIAPTLAALFAEHIFAAQGLRAMGYGVALVAAITPFIAVSLLLAARRSYAAALRQHLPSMADRPVEPQVAAATVAAEPA